MEEKTNRRKEERTEHKRASKLIFISCIVVAFLVVIGLLSSLALLLFPVKQIEVWGDSRYSYTEIIEVSGIKRGARLYYVNTNKAEQRVLSALPYLKNVEIESYFPNKVKITIKEFEDIYLIRHERGFCYVNSDFEILEIVPDAPSYEEFSGICIKLEKKASGEIGEKYEYEDAQRATVLIDYIKKYGFYSYLNIVDVDEKYNNSFVVGKRYKFVIGAMADVEEKINASFKVVLSDEFKREENCIIDSTDRKKVISRYVNDEIIRQEFDFCEK